MLIWQPYLLACQLASRAADGQAAALDQSVQDQSWSRQTPSKWHWARSGLHLCRKRKGLASPTPVPTLTFQSWKMSDQKSLERRWIRRTEKEWPACTCRRSRMKTKYQSIQSRHTPCPRNVPGSEAWRLSYYRKSLAVFCLSTLNLQVRAFLFVFCISSSKTATVSNRNIIMTRKYLFDPFVTICHVP